MYSKVIQVDAVNQKLAIYWSLKEVLCIPRLFRSEIYFSRKSYRHYTVLEKIVPNFASFWPTLKQCCSRCGTC